MALRLLSEGKYQGTASPAYWNRVGPFGGMTAAMMLNAVLISPQRLGDPVALTVNYAAAMAAAPYQLNTRVVRSSRTTQHWNVELVQEEKIVATATAICALRRETWQHSEVSVPEGLPSAVALSAPTHSHSMPWSRQYDLRPVRVSALSEQQQASLGSTKDPQVPSHAWIRDHPPRPLDYPALASICDTVLPWMFRRRKEIIQMSTVSMSIYFHVSKAELDRVGEQYVYTKSFGQICHAGFMDSQAQIWSQDKVLLATMQQLMWVKE